MTEPRKRQESHPILDSRDEPRAISPAEFDAHMRAHALLETRLNTVETNARNARSSDSIALRGPNGWSVRGRGGYLTAIAFFAVVGVVVWFMATRQVPQPAAPWATKSPPQQPQ
jgi:hypothetical protein